MRDIFAKQYELNERIMKKCGYNIGAVLTNDDTRAEWAGRYNQAIISEYVEFLRAIDIDDDEANAKLELIDILHFIVSQAILVDLDPVLAVEYCDDFEEIIGDEFGEDSTDGMNMVDVLMIAMSYFQDATCFKWWATGCRYNKALAQHGVGLLFSVWASLVDIFDVGELDFDIIKRVYMAKHAVNHKRQDDGYDLSTKTEDDNLNIVKEVL